MIFRRSLISFSAQIILVLKVFSMDMNLEGRLTNYASWKEKSCLIIEGINPHEKMIRKVIEAVSGADTKVTTLINQVNYVGCNELKDIARAKDSLLEKILNDIKNEVDNKGVNILNLSGDVATTCYFLSLLGRVLN